MGNAAAPAPAESRRLLLLSLLLGAVTLAVYWPAQNHEFLNYDDPSFTYGNEHVARGLTWDGVVWAFTTGHTGYQLPLTWLSLMLDVSLFGMHPGGFLFTNILLHTVNTILLFLLMRRLAGGWLAPFFVATVFAWHPTHVESVAWIAERKDVLSWFFALLAMQGYASWTTRPRVWRYVAFVLVPFGLAILSKPMLVVLPVLLLAFDIWPLNRLQPWPAAWAPPAWADWLKQCGVRLAEKVPLLLISLGYGLLAMNIAETRNVNAPWDQFPLYARLIHMVDAYGMYVRNFFLPFDLCILHMHPRQLYPWHETAVRGLVLAGFSVLAIVLFRFHRATLAGWLWFGAALFLVSGLFQNGSQIIANRYTYIPYIGLAAAVAYPIETWARYLGGFRPWFLALVLAGVCSGMIHGSRKQLASYRGSVELWDHAILCVANNSIALANIAPALTQQRPGPSGFREALAKSLLSFEQLESNPVAPANAGHYAWILGSREEAIPLLEAAVRMGTGNGTPYFLLARDAAMKGDFDKAYERIKQSAEAAPDPDARALMVAQAAANAGRFRDAVQVLERVLERQPGWVAATARLAVLLGASPDEGLRNSSRTLELAASAALLSRKASEHTELDQLEVMAAVVVASALQEKKDFALDLAVEGKLLSQKSGAEYQRLIFEDFERKVRAGKPIVLPIRLVPPPDPTIWSEVLNFENGF